MKREWILIPVACFSLALSGVVEAQSNSRLRTSVKSPRLNVSNPVSRGVNIGQVSRGSAAIRGNTSVRRPPIATGGSFDRGRRPSSGQRPFGGQSPFGNGNISGNPLGSLLGQYLNQGGYGFNRGFDPYAGQKAQAKAYRDVAIANAVVNVVGILATANQPRIQAACPPGGVVAAPESPCGYVERQRILVQEGRTEEYKVWIPEHTIPETGEVVEGHHETRRRDIPPVYQEREVWVPTR